MAIHMASTKIAPEKTAAEIHGLLAMNKARRILNEYEGGELIALSFTVEIQGKEVPFRLPARWEKCLEAMKEDHGTPRSLCKPDQAKRTAWRIVLRWLQAQFALIETQMADFAEVMLPYAQMQSGETFYEKLTTNGFNLLPDLRGK